MAKKKTTTTTKGGAGFGGTQNDDDDESSVQETTMNDENFSFDVGTPVWVKDANHAWVAASISKVGSGDLSSGEGTSSSLFFECTFAEDEDDGREEKKKNNSNGGNGGGGKGGGKVGDLSLASAQPTTIVITKENAKEDLALRERNTEEDMVKLSYLHEAGVLHNLRRRYARDEIYTYTGQILIAVNPFQKIPHLYDQAMMEMYGGAEQGELSPHVYAVAEAAYKQMLSEGGSQSILVSGESGAGKTETAKHIMQYLAHSAKHEDGTSGVEKQVLETNPLLEAFGNAKTVRNDNSSRFGKFTEILFDEEDKISGAAIRTYLLERSRVVRVSDPERNFHVFYQILAGASKEEKSKWRLDGKTFEDFYYLNQSKCVKLERISDVVGYEETQNAMEVVGISESEREDVFGVVSGVLHLGNIDFSPSPEDEDASVVASNAKRSLEDAASVLKVDKDRLEKALISRQIVTADGAILKPLSVSDAKHNRDSLAKMLYSRLFDWLVERINQAIGNKKEDEEDAEDGENITGDKKSKRRFIGVLDIYGFESFKKNSFEQFCINFANEKLQQHFNQKVFKMEQEEYEKEAIDWSYIEFVDNQDILDVIERKVGGIISLLDESCIMTSTTSEQFAQKLFSALDDEKRFSKPKRSQIDFTLNHYAGDVTYESENFIEKNKDYAILEHTEVLSTSETNILRLIFEEKENEILNEGNKPPPPRAKKSAMKFTSIGNSFKHQLNDLMKKLHGTEPHFVRCVKPNQASVPSTFENANILQQLRCGGVLEAVRISCAGYPSRKPIELFLTRFGLLAPDEAAKFFTPGKEREALEGILNVANLQEWQIGKTKVFLRSGQMAVLDTLRSKKLGWAAVEIQKHVKRRVAQKQYKRTKSAAETVNKYARGMFARKIVREIRQTKAVTAIQAFVRMSICKKQFAETKEAAVKIQTLARAVKARKEFLELKERNLAAIRAQSVYRGQLARNRVKEIKKEQRDVAKMLEAKSELEKKLEAERARAKMLELQREEEKVKREAEEEEKRKNAEKEREEREAKEKIEREKQQEEAALAAKKAEEELKELRERAQKEELLRQETEQTIKKELEEANKTADQYEKALREALEENEKLRDRLAVAEAELDSFRNGLKTPGTAMMTGGPGGGKSRARMMNGTPLSASSLNTPMSAGGGEIDQSVDKEVPDSTSPQTISLKEDHEALRALLGHERAHEIFATPDGSPALAVIVFRCLLRWKAFSLERTSLFERILGAFENSLNRNAKDDNKAVAFWLTNAFALLHLLHRTLKNSGNRNRRGGVGILDRINSTISSRLKSPPTMFNQQPSISGSSDKENADANKTRRTSVDGNGHGNGGGGGGGEESVTAILGVKQIEAKYPGFLFRQSLGMFCEKAYGILRDNTKSMISPHLGSCIQAPRQRTGAIVGGKSTNDKDGKHMQLSSHWMSILEELDTILLAFTENNVPKALTSKFFTQIFCFINVNMFNALLLRRECCSFSNGEYIAAGLSELENWLNKNAAVVGEAPKKELRFINQAVQLLVINQKPRKTLNEITLELCPVLSIQQLYRICTMYWDDKYGTETVNQDVLKQMKNSMMDQQSNNQHNSFLLDDDSSIHFNVEEIAESSLEITLDFQSKDDLPEELAENEKFAFLSTRLTAGGA